jgi:hypothetical protein
MSTHFGRQNTLHRQDVNLLKLTERWNNFGTDQVCSNYIDEFGHLTTTFKDALVRHITGCSLGDEVCLSRRNLEDAVFDWRANEAIRLSVPEKQRRAHISQVRLAIN